MAKKAPKKLKMADLLRESPNLIDDLFKELEDWEVILKSLPDFGVDRNRDEMELPASAVG